MFLQHLLFATPAFCNTCAPSAVSPRQLLYAGTVGAIAVRKRGRDEPSKQCGFSLNDLRLGRRRRCV
jgi:hypothetical protein